MYRKLIAMNASILLSSLTAIIFTSIIMEMLPLHSFLLITIVSLVIDGTIDMGMYAFLHFIAVQKHKYLHTVTKVQIQRFALVPIFYVCASLTQLMWLALGASPGLSVILGHGFALLVTRSIHTTYCVKRGFLCQT